MKNMTTSKRKRLVNLRSGSLMIQLLVAMIVYSVAIIMIFESLTYLFKNLSKLSEEEKETEKFEYVMFYLNSQIEKNVAFKIENGINWSVLLLDTKPILGFEIFYGKNQNKLRRIVAKTNLNFSIIQKTSLGLGFLNGRNFSGFNTIYQGKERMYFKRDGTHLLFEWGERWFYLM